MPLTATAVASAVAGGVQMFQGISQEKKDKAELAALHQPFYKIQSEFEQNKNIAAGMAMGGLPKASKNYATSEAQRGLSSSLSALSQTGGSPNDISKLLDSYNRSIERTGAEDAEQQIKNIQYYMGANKDLAGEKIKQWSINEYQPYQAKLKELTQRIGADKQNISGGVNSILGAGTAFATGSQNQQLLNKLFTTPGGQKQDPFMPSSSVSPEMKNENWYQTPNPSAALPGFDGPSINL